MKKYIVLGMLCLVGMNSYAQKLSLDLGAGKEENRISPKYRENTEAYAIQIRQVVIQEKLALEAEISKVEEDLKKGILTTEEANNLKADIALRFSERINSGIESIVFDLDEAVKQQVQFSILNTDVEQLKKEQGETSINREYRAKNQLVGYLSYGMITLEDGDSQKLNDHLGYSSGIDFGMIYHKQFGKTSPVEFLSGAYLSWRTIRFDDDYFIDRDVNGNIDLIQHSSNLDKSKLRATYIMIPVGLKYSFAKLKTSNGESYRNTSNGIGIAANVYGGFRISTNNIVDANDMDYRDKKTNYKLNDFAYGAQLTLSINDWNFFVRQELSPLFKDGVFDDRKMLQFGINMGF